MTSQPKHLADGDVEQVHSPHARWTTVKAASAPAEESLHASGDVATAALAKADAKATAKTAAVAAASSTPVSTWATGAQSVQ